MVLRGSNTHPQYDLFEVAQAMETARQYIKETELERKELEHELAEVIHDEVAHLREGEKTKVEIKSTKVNDVKMVENKELQIPQDLTNAIRILVDRLDDLEKKHEKAETMLVTYRQEFKITCLQLLCGGVAGATARTVVSPIDRIKLLIQTARVREEQPKSMIATGAFEIQKNGIRSLWRGNLTNCIRVFPYAAIQFASYDRYKLWVVDWCERHNRAFGHLERLTAGALAGGTAATLTYPLDVMRLVQAVVPEAKGPSEAIRYIYKNGGVPAFFKGWVPTVMSLGPFIAINFATFDYLKQTFLPEGNVKGANSLLVLGLGATAGLVAQSVCYPLDTIRRVMQIPGAKYVGIMDCLTKIIKKDGPLGMYRGMVPNAVKIVPNNGIRFWVYTHLTTYLNLPKKGGGD